MTCFRKIRVLDALILSLFISCGEDVPPEKTVGSITFIITEENTPETLSGVAIQLFWNDDRSYSYSDKTDNSGRCSFSGIPVGSYQMNLSKPGFESRLDIPIQINAGNNPDQELSLKMIGTMITISPNTLDFGKDESVVQKSFSIVNPDYERLNWAIMDTDVPWIVSVCDKDGKTSGTLLYKKEVALYVTISREIGKLENGPNQTKIIILAGEDGGKAAQGELTVNAEGAERSYARTSILTPTDVTTNSAVLNGEIVDEGSPSYDERGFVYSTLSIENEQQTGLKMVSAPKNDKKSYSCAITGLKNKQQYYVRAFAKNKHGIKFSANQVVFTTIGTQTVVVTDPITNIDYQRGSAQFNGKIKSVGDPEYTEKGFYYGKTETPYESGTKQVVTGTSGGGFSYMCTGLELKTTYYVQAYAIQNGDRKLGAVLGFKTEPNNTKTSISTESASNVKATSATLNGKVVSSGYPKYSEKGFCFNLSGTPTIYETKCVVLGNDEGPYSASVTELFPDRTYHFRAYAIQEGEVVYGTERIFYTQSTQANIVLGEIKDITFDSATFSASVSSLGDPVYTKRGFYYGTLPEPSREAGDDCIEEYSSSLGSFSMSCNSIRASENTKTTYYVRAFVEQAGEIHYSNEKSFTLDIKPVVVAYNELVAPEYINESGSVFWRGEIIGGIRLADTYQDLGFVYGTRPDPIVNSSRYTQINRSSESISGNTRMFVAKVSFANNTRYYVRAYVKTRFGYVYSDQVEITMTTKEPIIQVVKPELVSALSNGTWTATFIGKLFYEGMPPLTDLGFVYGLSSNPKIDDGSSVYVSQQYLHQFDDFWALYTTVNGLGAGKTYYVRVCGKTDAGYTYSSVLSFNTF